MNAQRRKALREIISELETLKAKVADLAGEERDAYDAMPESIQQGERGEAASESADSLEGADSTFDELCEALELACGEC